MRAQSGSWEVVDVFAGENALGNPAGVVFEDGSLNDETRLAIARSAGFSETAFVGNEDQEGIRSLRWFTPTTEVKLCGHATLAAAACLRARGSLGSGAELIFSTRSGRLKVRESNSLLYVLLPEPERVSVEAAAVETALALPFREAFVAGNYLYVETLGEESVAFFDPLPRSLPSLEWDGLVVTAVSNRAGTDFVSRCFYPKEGIPEDPATGSAHAALGPYWAAKLGRMVLRARQLSERGGELHVRPSNGGVWVGGAATLRPASSGVPFALP